LTKPKLRLVIVLIPMLLRMSLNPSRIQLVGGGF
jgi:hypothetical protein